MISDMRVPVDNPFSVTRAADFTDQQIYQYWVDLADSGGFFELVKPRSEMPMLILGGKGSGKTHIMRYLSFNSEDKPFPFSANWPKGAPGD